MYIFLKSLTYLELLSGNLISFLTASNCFFYAVLYRLKIVCYRVPQVKGGVLKKSLHSIKIQFGQKVIMKIKINKSYDTECSKSYFSFNSILQLKKINIFVNLRKKTSTMTTEKNSGFPSSVEKKPRDVAIIVIHYPI